MTATWPPGRRFPRPVSAIVIHHSATADSGTLSWPAIARFHVEQMGFDAVGYHAGIEWVVGDYRVILGRPPWRTGAHTKERDSAGVRWNHKSLGFCFVGDFDAAEPPPAALELAAALWLAPTLKSHGLTAAALIPHSAIAGYKTCPGVLFPIGELRDICDSLLKE